ncbi:MAG: Kelch repeat-containing protein, partial [Anaerolineae bacterium]
MGRQLILSLVLALLGVCILFVTAHAYVIRRIETTLDDFYTGTFLYTGLLDIPAEGIDSVQLLPIGLTGDWQTSAHHLPQGLANLATVANGEWIYTIGGTIGDSTGRVRQEVYAAQMDPEGDTTAWQTETPLPEPRAGASAVVYTLDEDTSAIYAIGGFDATYASVNTIYRATMNHETGHIGGWVAAGQTLPVASHYASAVEHGGRLYVIGGLHHSSATRATEPLDSVYYCPINTNGSLGDLVAAAPLPNPTYNSYVVVYEGEFTDTLYVIGGMALEEGEEEPKPTYQVYFADLLEGGGLTGWTASEGRLPVPQWGHGGALVNGGEILVTGGFADPVNPMTGISSTVKSALVDVDDPNFRLYDWCLGVPQPMCTIGAWQSGELLPEVRALHGTVAGRTHIYVIGGLDERAQPRDTVYFGSVTGQGALYSPDGIYRSKEMYLGPYPATMRRLTWDVTYGYDQQSISMQYRTSGDGDHWSAWSEPVTSGHGYNKHEPSPAPSGFRYVQYQASFSTAISIASPLLNQVEVYYEVADPDLSVSKDTGAVISATLGSDLQYNIHYANTGHWQAEKAYLTEIVPEHTSYAVNSGWHQVGSSNVYTFALGTVPAGDSGSVPFMVRVDQDV